MGLPETGDSTFDWREVGAQVNKLADDLSTISTNIEASNWKQLEITAFSTLGVLAISLWLAMLSVRPEGLRVI